ncbi:MAG: hypothetical protein WBK55_10110 [Alphaproteobacteria bacterium]
MRYELKNLMEKLGVNRVLSPYETQPWLHYDTARGIACSAEVRMGPDSEDIEAEIQMLKDAPGEDGKTTEQIMLMKILPGGDKLWMPTDLRVRSESYVNKIYDWEGKGCNFFRACIQAIQMSDLPDIDALIEQELGDDDDWGGGKRGKIGRKAPKIKPAQLLGIKRGF